MRSVMEPDTSMMQNITARVEGFGVWVKRR